MTTSVETMTSRNSIILMGDDQKQVVMDSVFAKYSTTIKNLLEDSPEKGTPIPINISSETLTFVKNFCSFFHLEDTTTTEKKEDSKEQKEQNEKRNTFLSTLEQEQLFSLILACNYLDIKCMLDSCCQFVANMIKGKTPENIRSMFNIKNDFTPEEEEQLRKENEWVNDS